LAAVFDVVDASIPAAFGAAGDSTASGAAGPAEAAGTVTWGMSATAKAAASPEPTAIAMISCGLADSVPSTATRPPDVSGPDSRRLAFLTSL